MPTVHFGRKDEAAFELVPSPDLFAVRTRSGRPLTRGPSPVASPWSAHVADCSLVLDFPEAGVRVYRVPARRGSASVEARKAALRAAPDVRFAGGVLVDAQSQAPVLYTENLFVKFVDSADPAACRGVLQAAGLTIKDEPGYAVNAFFCAAPEGTGLRVFEIAQALLMRADVEYSHPELIRERRPRLIFAQQWHLKKTRIGQVEIDAHANVEAAHALSRGAGVTVAVIDDGIDIDHVEFAGTGKLVAPQDMLPRSDNPRPRLARNNHGTACAGVAVANGSTGASGVAPAARLMPIRLQAGLGSITEAEAFRYAADQGADIISCSWGPPDGDWWDHADPAHAAVTPLPASTRLAMDYAATQGRGGKGCVLVYAAGNGNESVDNDGYATHPAVLAIAACNDRGQRAIYSDFGRAIWCCFPSNDFALPEANHPPPLTPGIWTTDRSGAPGYNRGAGGTPAGGDSAGLFTNSFGGTSSACPGAAGVAALVLAVQPGLRRSDVADVLKRACDRIDPQGGQYDAAGRSAFYGWGRLNALRAVELAQPQPRNELTVSRRFDAPLPDLGTVRFALDVTDSTPVRAVGVAVDLLHSHFGDLVLTLLPPAAMKLRPLLLHQRGGGTRNSLKKVYDAENTPALAACAGRSCAGRWTLQVEDAEAQDSGTLASFSIRLMLNPDGAIAPNRPGAKGPGRKSAAKPDKKPDRKTAGKTARKTAELTAKKDTRKPASKGTSTRAAQPTGSPPPAGKAARRRP